MLFSFASRMNDLYRRIISGTLIADGTLFGYPKMNIPGTQKYFRSKSVLSIIFLRREAFTHRDQVFGNRRFEADANFSNACCFHRYAKLRIFCRFQSDLYGEFQSVAVLSRDQFE